jgi:hypothetical protein
MSDLTEQEARALVEALDDEYKAWTTYDRVIADFGEARPFSTIRESEGRHISALRALFERYGLAVPQNSWPGKVPRYPSLQAACEAGVEAEIANGAMYERLLAATQRADIVTVLRNLQEASQQRHLPAFRRGAGGGGGYCGGGGRGSGGGDRRRGRGRES